MRSFTSAIGIPAIAFSTAFGLSGCGGGSGSSDDSTPPARQGNEGRDGTGDASGRSQPTPVPSPIRTPGGNPTPVPSPVADDRQPFEFTYRGIPGPMKARVDPGARIKIESWPKLMSPTLVLPRQVDFARVTNDFCSGIEASARAGRRDLVRGWDSFVASIEVMPFATIDFTNVVRRKALDAIGGVGGPVLTNQPGLARIRARVVLGEGSITAILGDTSALEAIFTKVPVSLQFGTWNGEISAMDLVCDLKSGKAKLVFEAETDVPGYSPTSEVSSLGGPT